MWNGQMRKLMLFANRNAFFYVLDRETGEFLQGTPFARQTWAERLDERGRPVVLPGTAPTKEGNQVAPPLVGATNWWSPSYSPRTGLFYVRALDAAGIYWTFEPEFRPGEFFVGGGMQPVGPDESTMTALRALDPEDGSLRWEYELQTPSDQPRAQYKSQAGILSTAGDLVFNGTREGFFFALDATEGTPLWEINLGGTILAPPISYTVDGNQHIMIAAGHALVCLGLETPVR